MNAINQSRPPGEALTSLRYWQMRMFIVTWVAYASFYLTRQALSGAKLGILDDPIASLILTREMLGTLDAIYLTVYALGQFVWGGSADRWGVRVVVLTGLLLSATTALVMGLVPALILFVPLIAIQAAAQSTGWAALCKNVNAFFPLRARGRMMGLWSTCFIFGGLIGTPFAGWLAYGLFDSWRMAFIGSSVVLFVIAGLFYLGQRNTLTDAGLVEEAPAEHAATVTAERPPFKDTLLAPLRNAMVFKLGLSYFLLKPARYAILFWGPVIAFDAIPSLSFLGATVLPLAFGLAGLLAPMALGWLSDKVFDGKRIPVAVLSLVFTILILLLFMPLARTGSIPLFVLALALLGFFLYGAEAIISAVAAIDFGTQRHAGAALGFINGCGAIGAILGGWLPGFMAEGTLFMVFAVAAGLSTLILLPSWNRRAEEV
ncbi:MAG: MFS transporter [Neisseriaceae bacterium]|nr:MFS transporter [Neisseriaceae bacterium]